MSYTPQTWVTGDTITAEKLNHMENGISEVAGLEFFNIYYDDSSEITFYSEDTPDAYQAIWTDKSPMVLRYTNDSYGNQDINMLYVTTITPGQDANTMDYTAITSSAVSSMQSGSFVYSDNKITLQ